MPSQPPLPPLLTPYLSLPPSTLTLLTSTLGASSNWLVLRFLYASLSLPTQSPATLSPSTNPSAEPIKTHIILISWLRDFSFWKDGAKKLGLDLSRSGQVTFIDGLGTGIGLGEDGILRLERRLLAEVKKAKGEGGEGKRVVLVVDGLDFVLAASEGAAVQGVLDMVGELRENVHALLLILSADAPLLHARHTPLETNHASLMMSLAHQAHSLMGVRELDTGVARDVSGVLRIGRGGGEGTEDVEEKEVLYFVGSDGGVRVFERGA